MTRNGKRRLLLPTILVCLGVVSFFASRIPRMWRTSIEETATGRLVSHYDCGQRTQLLFFSNRDQHPYRMFEKNGISWSQCIATFLAMETVEDAIAGSVSVYVDIEADGEWDRRLDFDGNVNDSVSINDVQFDYFERVGANLWEPTIPVDRYATFCQMVYDSVR